MLLQFVPGSNGKITAAAPEVIGVKGKGQWEKGKGKGKAPAKGKGQRGKGKGKGERKTIMIDPKMRPLTFPPYPLPFSPSFPIPLFPLLPYPFFPLPGG